MTPTEKGGKHQNGRVAPLESVSIHLNTIAIRKAKIVCNFGLSEYNRVKGGACATKNLLLSQFLDDQNIHVVPAISF